MCDLTLNCRLEISMQDQQLSIVYFCVVIHFVQQKCKVTYCVERFFTRNPVSICSGFQCFEFYFFPSHIIITSLFINCFWIMRNFTCTQYINILQ